MKTIFKLLYLFTRGTSIFTLPFFRKLRVFAYEKNFDCKNIFVGESVLIVPSHYHKSSAIKISDGVSIGSHTLLDYSGYLSIGKHCTISEGVKIYTHTHELTPDILDIKKSNIVRNSLHIGDYTWIGANAVILPTVKKIGVGAIIAAGSVVTKDVEDFTVVAGNPAKFIKNRKINNQRSIT